METGKKRLILSSQRKFRHSCRDLFPLLCPVKEDDWIPGWAEQRTIVYSQSGLAEPGCVFITTGQSHLMGSALWVNNIYRPFEEIQYSAVNDHLVYQIHFNFKELSSGCEVLLRRTWTALTPEAEKFLVHLEQESKHHPPDLFNMADYYLTTGKMISI